MDPRRASENLIDAVALLEALGLRPFLVDGTLLGAVREGGFIAHDKDVDIGLMADEWVPGIDTALTKAGFAVWKVYGERGRGLQYSFTRHGIKLDIFFYYRGESELFHAAWLKGDPIRYGYPTFELSPLMFLGRQFMAPADPEQFLRTKYGQDWRRPVVNWDWAWGPRNARKWVAT